MKNQLSFKEYWEYLANEDKQKFRRFKLGIQTALGITLDRIYYRKRFMKFTKSERTAVCNYINKFEGADSYTEAKLFPNSIEQYA